MKALISRDEWAPCFYLSFGDTGVEISEELKQRYLLALKEFDSVQAELEKLYYSGRAET